MTRVHKAVEQNEIFSEWLDSKDNPDEWYVLLGSHVGKYSVWSDSVPEEVIETQDTLPEDERPAQPYVDGTIQIGTSGWNAEAFEDDNEVVKKWSGKGGGLSSQFMHMLLVHEDMLSDEVVEKSNEHAAKAAIQD